MSEGKLCTFQSSTGLLGNMFKNNHFALLLSSRCLSFRTDVEEFDLLPKAVQEMTRFSIASKGIYNPDISDSYISGYQNIIK